MKSLPSSFPHSGNSNDLLKTEAAMKIFGYRDRTSFLRLVHKQAIPYLRFNSMVMRFRRGALEDWLRQRSVG